MNTVSTAFRAFSLAFALVVTGGLMAGIDGLAHHERAEAAVDLATAALATAA